MEELRDSFNRLVGETLTMEEPRLNKSQSLQFSDDEDSQIQTTIEENSTEVSEKNQNLFQQLGNKIVKCHKIRYTATRIKYSTTTIKSRDFLYNISYSGINKNDFYNKSFILDVYVLFVKNLIPFSMSGKLTNKVKYEMVYML